MGVLEEGAKAAGGVIDALRGSPVALAMGIMNIALLLFLFYYLSRITARTEVTVQSLFQANDKLYAQWGIIIKDTNALTEKAMHCVLPEDVERLQRSRPPAEPQRPSGPAPLRWPAEGTWPDPPKSPPVDEPSKPAPVDDPPKAVGEGEQGK
jgi:hypothetical protein